MERARAHACPRRYTPRRPEQSPLYHALFDHFEQLKRMHEERFERAHGPLRPGPAKSSNGTVAHEKPHGAVRPSGA
jgi:hypothetical protein